MSILKFLKKEETLNLEEVEKNVDISKNVLIDNTEREKIWISNIFSFIKNYISTNEQLTLDRILESEHGYVLSFDSKDVYTYGEFTLINIDGLFQEVEIFTYGLKLPEERFVEFTVGISKRLGVSVDNDKFSVRSKCSSISDNYEFDEKKLADFFDRHFIFYKNTIHDYLYCIENNIDFTRI